MGEVPPKLQATAEGLLRAGLDWLKDTYPEHRFFVERDVVWTLQKWLVDETTLRGLPLRIRNDCSIERGTNNRRSLCADLALLAPEGSRPLVVAEFKFEPSHSRAHGPEPEIDPRKLPVTGWDGFARDVNRVQSWTQRDLIGSGAAIFVDEGSCARPRTELIGATHEDWGTYGKDKLKVTVHIFRTASGVGAD